MSTIIYTSIEEHTGETSLSRFTCSAGHASFTNKTPVTVVSDGNIPQIAGTRYTSLIRSTDTIFFLYATAIDIERMYWYGNDTGSITGSGVDPVTSTLNRTGPIRNPIKQSTNPSTL